ncbi:MAG: hypothetical protein WA705_07985 [Candidatus Ozemobacteraceae bacterium]
MNISISDLFFRFSERSMPVKQVAEHVAHTQNEFYFNLAVLKNNRREQLKAHFSRTKVRKLLVGAGVSGIEFELAGLIVERLDKGFFHEDDPQKMDQKQAYLEDAVVIVNNNDVGHQGDMPYYATFYTNCDKTIFVAWDWDNHHWLELSTFLAAHSDIYAPSHHENLFLLTRFNWLTVGPVYCSTIQWSRKYLSDHLSDMLTYTRSDAPLGMHIPYAPFHFRMQVITTLNKHYPSIGFSDRTFHVRTTEDRLKEWYSHKSHWIVPVLNDVPIRLFDALVTGGIPIVPESLRFLPPVREIKRDYIVFYNPLDIINPEDIVTRANRLFDGGGAEKLVERHVYALNHHHVNVSIRQLLNFVNEAFTLHLPN